MPGNYLGPGQSGSAVYQLIGGVRTIIGVHTRISYIPRETSQSTSYNVAVRIDPTRYQIICSYVAQGGKGFEIC